MKPLPTASDRSTPVRIKKAEVGHREAIRRLYVQIKSPHARRIHIREYFVALVRGKLVGCAAIRSIGNSGYLYGRAVAKDWRRRGVGTALLARRIQWLRRRKAKAAFALVMFWNVSTFRRLGFRIVSRAELPKSARDLRDFRDDRNRHSATLWIEF